MGHKFYTGKLPKWRLNFAEEVSAKASHYDCFTLSCGFALPEMLLSYRANRLAARFPTYDRHIVRDFSKSDP
jgi:hypothetical protein